MEIHAARLGRAADDARAVVVIIDRGPLKFTIVDNWLEKIAGLYGILWPPGGPVRSDSVCFWISVIETHGNSVTYERVARKHFEQATYHPVRVYSVRHQPSRGERSSEPGRIIKHNVRDRRVRKQTPNKYRRNKIIIKSSDCTSRDSPVGHRKRASARVVSYIRFTHGHGLLSLLLLLLPFNN